MIFYLIKSIRTVISGHHIKSARSVISLKITRRKITRSMKMSADLTKIPMPIENPTNPFLYSFFKGLKKVRTIRVSDRICKIAWFTERKYFAIRGIA